MKSTVKQIEQFWSEHKRHLAREYPALDIAS